MFNIYSFYRTEVLKLHYFRFFYEKNCKEIEKLILCHKANEIKYKITPKTTRKLKVNPHPNYATFMIEFCLFVSLE